MAYASSYQSPTTQISYDRVAYSPPRDHVVGRPVYSQSNYSQSNYNQPTYAQSERRPSLRSYARSSYTQPPSYAQSGYNQPVQGNYAQSSYSQVQPAQSQETIDVCVSNHDPARGQSYPWLEALGHGKLVRTWFKEPANAKEFTPYDSHWWDEHCHVVDHGENLFQSHVATFTGPQRTIAMFFEFEDGSLIEAEPKHYALEHYYFNGEWPAGYTWSTLNY